MTFLMTWRSARRMILSNGDLEPEEVEEQYTAQFAR